MQLNIHITIPSLILRTDEKINLDSSLQMCQGDNFQFHILKWGGGEGGEGSEKKCLGGLKEFLLWIIAWGSPMFLVKKT